MLSGAAVQVDPLSDDFLLGMIEDAEVQVREAERRKLRLALAWAQRHIVADADQAAHWSDASTDRELRDVEETLGGEGTPLIASSCVEPLATALGVSARAAMQLVSDVLDLSYRHPAIWSRVQSLQVAPWRARRIAAATHTLSARAAAYVDQRLARIADSCGVVKIDRLVTEATVMFDPSSQAVAEDEAQAAWGVRVEDYSSGPWSGTSRMEIVGDTPTLRLFRNLLGTTAHELLDPDLPADQQPPLDQRLIAALGVICAGNGATSVTTLNYHLDAAAVAALPDPIIRMGRVERLGPLSVEAIASRLGIGEHRFHLRPVLDLNRDDGVDGHDPPEWMHELVVQRDRTCVFPWCTKDSRDCDLDHLEPYVAMDDGGPPGQTNPHNLAPLCRRHHRAKTHRGWRYVMSGDSRYIWTSPHGRRFVVSPDGSVARDRMLRRSGPPRRRRRPRGPRGPDRRGPRSAAAWPRWRGRGRRRGPAPSPDGRAAARGPRRAGRRR